MAIEVINKVEIYEINDEIVNSEKYVTIKSHWNDNEEVVIDINNKKYTFLARDLINAINNATNVH